MLEKISDPRLRAYVVWVPMLGGREKDVPEATATAVDGRASHFWDEQGYLLEAYAPVLGLKERAWDLYMVYGPGARWDGDTPPSPEFWMHQLRTPDPALQLDAKAFALKVAVVLASHLEREPRALP